MPIKLVWLLSLIFLISNCSNGDHKQFEGYIEGENIYLASPFYGILMDLKVLRGQHVSKGQPLFSLDPNPQRIIISQIKAELEQAKSTLVDLKKPKRLQEIAAIEAQIEQTKALIKLAEIRVARYDKLYKKQATDKDTLDAAIANLQQQNELKIQYESNLALAKLGSREDQIASQQATVNALTAKLNQANWDLEQKSIRAPASGVIFDTYYRQGEFVGPQQAVLSLLTPVNIHIEFFVPLEYLDRLKIAQKISFDCVGCTPNNLAVIRYISPDAEYLPPLVYSRDNNSKLVFRIKASIENPLSFKPGQPVLVTI